MRGSTKILRQLHMMSSTLREMRLFLSTHMLGARFWLVFVAMIVMFSAIGPFGTFERLTLPSRFVYWTVTMVGAWLIAMATIGLVWGLLRHKTRPMLRTLLGSGLAAFPIALFLQFTIPMFFGNNAGTSFWNEFFYAAPISITFGIIVQLIYDGEDARNAQAPEPLSAENPLLNRLPVEKRGPIQHMSMQDHYVKVTTDKGSELVLMRLSDAIAALPGASGIQIHRSHWVALDAVADNKRIKGQPHIVLTDETELPVSRSFMKTAKAAGIL